VQQWMVGGNGASIQCFCLDALLMSTGVDWLEWRGWCCYAYATVHVTVAACLGWLP